MKHLRKLAAVLIALVLMIQCLPATAQAAAVVESGTCGDNLTWTLDDAGTLTISGTGAMANYSDREAPWYNLSVKKIVVQSGVTSIGNCAFTDMSELSSISLPSSVKSLGLRAIYYTGIESITLPSSVKSIDTEAFAKNYGLKTINIPNGISEIPTSAFEDCSALEEIVLPDSVTSIGFAAFRGCSSLERMQMSNNLKSIDSDAFRNCHGFEVLALPDSVTSIGESAFMDCDRLVVAYLPEKLTVISSHLFFSCDSLEAVFLPPKLTTIQSHAFNSCNALVEVYFLGDEEQLYEIEIYEGNDPLLNAAIYLATIIKQQPADVAVEAGETATFTVSASRDDVTYQWYYAAPEDEVYTEYTGKTANSATLKVTATEDMNGYFFCCVVTDEYGGQAQSREALLVVSPKPQVTRQPESVTVKYGETATVEVEATGDDVTYQWYSKNAGASKFSKASITGPVYSIPMDETRDGREIYCLVTDAYGRTVQSETVTLKIDRTPLTIVTQPVDVSAFAGEKAAVEVVADGDNLTYQWYIMNKGGTKFSKASITDSVYSVPMDETRDGRQLYCVVTDAYGNTLQTNTVTMTMDIHPITILQQPVSVEVAKGETAVVETLAEGDDLTYQWFVKNPGGTKFYASSITGNVYSVTMDASRDGREVYCQITNSYGTSVQTDVATIRMQKPALTITVQPESVTAEPGQDAIVTVEAQGEGLTYQWYIKNRNSSKFALSSTTTATYCVQMDGSRHGRQLYCVITDAYGQQVTTDTVTLTAVLPSLTLVKAPESQTVARGELTSVSVEAEGEGLTYQWYHQNVGQQYFYKSSVQKSVYSVEMDDSRNGRLLYCVVTDAYGQQIVTDTVTIRMVDEPLAILEQPQNVTVPEGEKAVVSVKAQGTGLTYQWYVAKPGSDTFYVSSIQSNTYSTVMDSSRDGRRIYCVVTDANGQSVTSEIVTISMG